MSRAASAPIELYVRAGAHPREGASSRNAGGCRRVAVAEIAASDCCGPPDRFVPLSAVRCVTALATPLSRRGSHGGDPLDTQELVPARPSGRSLRAEHDRQATERWRRCSCGNEGHPIRAGPTGDRKPAQLARRMAIRAASWPPGARRTRVGTSRSTEMTITRAVLVLESAAPDDPSGRAYAASPRGPNGDRQAAASRPRSRSRRRSEPARGGR
jgi:hypothetical protein